MPNSVIIYTFTKYSSFVAKDYDILEKYYTVEKQKFDTGISWKIPFQFLKQVIVCLKNNNSTNIVFFSRFAGYHTFIPSLLAFIFPKVRSIIVLGGTDSNHLPSISYGNYNKKIYGLFTKWSVKLCSHLLPVSKFLIRATNIYAENKPIQQGVYSIIKNLKTPYTEIHNGFDFNTFKILNDKERIPKSFVTIASGIESEKKRKLKGIDLIIKAAEYFPDYTFTIIGSENPSFKVSENIKFVPFIKNDLLPSYLNEFQYYLQLSMSEGFPNALCESMLCGCIPIVSNVGIMPEIIENTGLVLKQKDDIINLLSNVSFENIESKSVKAREKIVSDYPIEKRMGKLLEVIEQIITK